MLPLSIFKCCEIVASETLILTDMYCIALRYLHIGDDEMKTISIYVLGGLLAVALTACSASPVTPTESTPIVSVEGSAGLVPQPTPIVTVEGSGGVLAESDELTAYPADCENIIEAELIYGETDGVKYEELVVAENFGRHDCFIFPDDVLRFAVPDSNLSDEALTAYNNLVVKPDYFVPEDAAVDSEANAMGPSSPSTAPVKKTPAPVKDVEPTQKVKAVVKTASPSTVPVVPSTPTSTEVAPVTPVTPAPSSPPVVPAPVETVTPAPVVVDGSIGTAHSGAVVDYCFIGGEHVATVDLGECSVVFAAIPPVVVVPGEPSVGVAIGVHRMVEAYEDGVLVSAEPWRG